MSKNPERDPHELFPAPPAITLQLGQPWSVITPTVYRYEDRQWVDAFFETGAIRLSSFAKFRSYEDEIRGDRREGTAVCRGVGPDGSDHLTLQSQGTTAAILCCSQRLDRELMEAFGRDAAFAITNTVGFAREIARQLPGYLNGIEGSCIYRNRAVINRRIGLNIEDYRRNDGTLDMQMISDVNREVGGAELLLLKQEKYAVQQEYRFVWELDRLTSEHVDLIAPNARQYCRSLAESDWAN